MTTTPHSTTTPTTPEPTTPQLAADASHRARRGGNPARLLATLVAGVALTATMVGCGSAEGHSASSAAPASIAATVAGTPTADVSTDGPPTDGPSTDADLAVSTVDDLPLAGGDDTGAEHGPSRVPDADHASTPQPAGDVADGAEGTPAGTIAKVSGGATGDGPASQADCDAYATHIGSTIDLAEDTLHGGGAGSIEAYEALENEAAATTDQAMSLGCFFVYT